MAIRGNTDKNLGVCYLLAIEPKFTSVPSSMHLSPCARVFPRTQVWNVLHQSEYGPAKQDLTLLQFKAGSDHED